MSTERAWTSWPGSRRLPLARRADRSLLSTRGAALWRQGDHLCAGCPGRRAGAGQSPQEGQQTATRTQRGDPVSGGLAAGLQFPAHQRWSDEQVLALYRARWQVELVIKRMKQVLRLAQLRGKTALTNEATILALLVCWALQQREAAPARALLCYSLVQVLKLAPMGVHPLESLALALAAHLPDRSLQILREDLESDSARGLHLLASTLTKHRETKVVPIVDQFEEVFSQSTAEEERQHFVDLLVTAVTEPHGPVMVILTLRADFSDRLMHYPELYRLLEAHQKAVLPMEIGDLRVIIEQPAALPDVQLTFEWELVGDLLFESQGQPGALPLLEFTLAQLFERRRGHTLTRQAYHEMGDIKGVLARHAEETYASLPSEEHRRLVRALFLRLIQPGVTEQDTTRRRASLSELRLPNPRETIILEEVTQAFITARLLTANTIAGVAMVEVSLEAVIREWARLANWLREAREDIHLQQTISQDAAAWERHGKPGDHLYRGARLKDAQVWATRNTPSRSEIALLRASALQRMLFLVSVLAVCLLLLSLATVAIQLALNKPPDPTRVTNLQDNGTGSLRWAIDNAPAGRTITFDERLRGKTIKLTSGVCKLQGTCVFVVSAQEA